MLDLDSRAASGRDEPDLDIGGVGAIGAQVPRVREPARRLPDRHPAPVVLVTAARPLEEAAADARLEDHAQIAFAGDRVIGRPPRGDPLGPRAERVLRWAGDLEGQTER